MIRQIEEKELYSFLQMYEAMVREIDCYKHLPSSVIALSVLQAMQRKNFFAFGDFKDEKLIGMICGYEEDKDTWYQLGLYNQIPFRAIKMIKEVEQELKDLGYTHWTTEYSKQDDKCLAPKIGAKILSTKYIKEI